MLQKYKYDDFHYQLISGQSRHLFITENEDRTLPHGIQTLLLPADT